MQENRKIKYKIDPKIVSNFVEAMNSISEPMNLVKIQLNELSKPMKDFNKSINDNSDYIKSMSINISESIKSTYEDLNSINIMANKIKEISKNYPNKQNKILTDSIKQIMNVNNGVITTRMIDPLNISRQYLSLLENNKEIEKISRGIYTNPNIFEDSFYSFQIKNKKTIFSHMNALYFYGMTEELPNDYTVTVLRSYHVDKVNDNCNVFYVSEDIIELGLCEVETPNGNKVRAYNLERSICDIIRSKSRMDFEQVKKSIKLYIKSEYKNINKLFEYSKKMGINEQVMEMVGMYID